MEQTAQQTKESPDYGIEVGKRYHIYGKMGAMKRFKPLNRDRFVTNLIYADIFNVDSESKKAAVIRELCVFR